MKSLIAMIILSLCIVSCSSMKDKFNDAKIDVSKEAKEFVTKELESAYASNDLVVVEGFSCESEAEEIGLNVEAELLKFLKAEQKLAAMSDQSLTGDVLPAACHFVNDKVVPALIAKIPSKYVCTKKLGASELIEIGNDLCELIK